MLYVKNLPTWERIVRVVAAVAMASCAWRFADRPPIAVIFGVMAVVTVVTGVIGFCPMCALAGRRLDARNGPRP